MDAPQKPPGLFDAPAERALALLGSSLALAVPVLLVLTALAAGEGALAGGLAAAFAAGLGLTARDIRRGSFGVPTGIAGGACGVLLALLAARLL